MKDWIGLAARLLAGGAWVAAGVVKLRDPAASVRAVRAYDLLPEAVVPTIGHLLPVVEVVVGLCLVAGLLVRPVAVASALLFAAFIAGIASAWGVSRSTAAASAAAATTPTRRRSIRGRSPGTRAS